MQGSLFLIMRYDASAMAWRRVLGFRYVLQTTHGLATPFSAYFSVTAAAHQPEAPAPLGDVPSRFWRVATGF